MANEAHLAQLQQGVGAWNRWRNKNREILPDLVWANLAGANLAGANLSWANLSWANLHWANLSGADLGGADLGGAHIGWTAFGDIDLSMVRGLDTLEHDGPSTIGIDTLYRSHGNISDVFLRGAGVPDRMMGKSQQTNVKLHRGLR